MTFCKLLYRACSIALISLASAQPLTSWDGRPEEGQEAAATMDIARFLATIINYCPYPANGYLPTQGLAELIMERVRLMRSTSHQSLLITPAKYCEVLWRFVDRAARHNIPDVSMVLIRPQVERKLCHLIMDRPLPAKTVVKHADLPLHTLMPAERLLVLSLLITYICLFPEQRSYRELFEYCLPPEGNAAWEKHAWLKQQLQRALDRIPTIFGGKSL